MPGDPYRIFREESQSKRETLKLLWPELYDALMPPATARYAWNCALHGDRQGPPVVGRLWRNGTPACAACIRRACDKPGGYPLERS